MVIGATGEIPVDPNAGVAVTDATVGTIEGLVGAALDEAIDDPDGLGEPGALEEDAAPLGPAAVEVTVVVDNEPLEHPASVASTAIRVRRMARAGARRTLRVRVSVFFGSSTAREGTPGISHTPSK